MGRAGTGHPWKALQVSISNLRRALDPNHRTDGVIRTQAPSAITSAEVRGQLSAHASACGPTRLAHIHPQAIPDAVDAPHHILALAAMAGGHLKRTVM